jgi:hypothetical protein
MELVSSKDLGFHADSGYKTFFYQPLLASTVCPDLVVAAMESRVRQPEFGVDYDYAYHWARFLVERDDTGVLRPFADEPEHQKRIRSFNFAEVEAKQRIIAELGAHLDEKTGTARQITALTIKNLNDDVAWASRASVEPDPSGERSAVDGLGDF